MDYICKVHFPSFGGDRGGRKKLPPHFFMMFLFSFQGPLLNNMDYI